MFPSLRPTSELLHRLNRAVASPRLKYAAILGADLLHLRHLIVRLDPVNACNLRCAMCFFSDPHWRKEHMRGHFSRAELERLGAMFFGEALQVHIGCGMEPTMFKDYPWLVALAKRHRAPFVGFTTNGQLLTSAAFQEMAEAGLDELTLSTHGVTAATYEALMVGADHARFLATLDMIDETKRRLAAKTPRLRLNYTVNPSNLDELEGFFDVYGKYEIATIQLRPIADFGDTAYTEKDMTPHLDRYTAMIERMIDECQARGIALLANRVDPTHVRPNPAAAVYLKAVLRYINPTLVWRDDFDWRNVDYRAHKRRIAWRRQLLDAVLRDDSANTPPSHQAAFDVL